MSLSLYRKCSCGETAHDYSGKIGIQEKAP